MSAAKETKGTIEKGGRSDGKSVLIHHVFGCTGDPIFERKVEILLLCDKQSEFKFLLILFKQTSRGKCGIDRVIHFSENNVRNLKLQCCAFDKEMF